MSSTTRCTGKAAAAKPTANKKPTKKKGATKAAPAKPAMEEDEEDEEDGVTGKVPMLPGLKKEVFKDPAKTTLLLNTITENEMYKNKLYPGTGQNSATKDGGGLSVTAIQWELAQVIWGTDHVAYFKWLAKSGAKARAAVGDKVKYRLKMLQERTKKIHQEMGQTGAGNTMLQAELDTLAPDDEHRSAWGAITQDFPWYWQLDILIRKDGHGSGSGYQWLTPDPDPPNPYPNWVRVQTRTRIQPGLGGFYTRGYNPRSTLTHVTLLGQLALDSIAILLALGQSQIRLPQKNDGKLN
ncbi:hypothetical protein C8F01DRAFT_1249132 [Mycena amicta]|nr:hypothetical protein C8F01DRAFT_1249132 [Mycena amicta]